MRTARATRAAELGGVHGVGIGGVASGSCGINFVVFDA
jgi:hypothetical protein